MTILIPAYEPDIRLLELIIHIRNSSDYNIVVVDDGSGEKYASIFNSIEEFGCTVLRHCKNLGKGRALKTGFEYMKKSEEEEGIVCADCDGQHLVEDIIKIAGEINAQKSHIILGCRHFLGKIPLRSRVGNTITRWVYAFLTGSSIKDTQTGLRGYSVNMLDWLCTIPGERFEYEMNMLLQVHEAGYSLREVAIDTVYLQNNRSSHFRPFTDSARVYLPILKFSASSALAGAADFLLLLILQCVTSNLALSVFGARAVSSVLNYCINKNYVFEKKAGVGKPAIKYFFLVLIVLFSNYLLMAGFYQLLGVPLILAKLLTETILFLFSYWTQKKCVFIAEK